MKFFLKCLLILFFASFFTTHAQTILHTELLGRPTNHSVTLQLVFADSIQVRVQYGTTSGSYTGQTNWQTFAGEEPAEIIIDNLTADTKYYYRVNYRYPNGSIQFRPEFVFQTLRPALSPFTFVIQADPHMDEQTDTAIYNRCLQNELEDAPDFMIDLGDVMMTDKMKDSTNRIPRDTVTYRTRLMRSYYEKVCHSVPLFITLGNHEGEAGWNLNGTPNNFAVWDTEDRKKYFLNPYPDNFYHGDTIVHPFVGQRENYYTWQWGDALFIVLDPYWYTQQKPDSLTGWNWTLGRVQYEWLKSTLQNSSARFKFVFAHQLVGGDPEGRGGIEFADLYEWGGNNLDGTPGFAANRPGWYKPIKELLTENRVSIFFHGHDHFFGKQEKDCLIYQEVQQPGHPNFSNVNLAASYGYTQGQFIPSAGHLRVSVDPNGVLVEYVRAYKAADENATRHNKDISASYYIGSVNCYDSSLAVVPILWNTNYSDEIVYPNPFSDNASIEFEVLQPNFITISVFDMNGKLVRTLLDHRKVNVGSFRMYWDGTNDAGISSPQGTYQYTITDDAGAFRGGKIIRIKK